MPPKKSKGKSDKAHKAAASAIAAATASTDSKRKPSGKGGKVAAGEGDLSANGHAVEGEAEEAEPVGALTMMSPRPTETAAEAPARPPTPAPVPAPTTTSMAPEMAPETAAETAPETAAEMAPENSGLLRRLLCSAGNERCFDCDELLQEPWFSLSYGVLLCERCASEHPGASALPPGGTVRPLPEEARVTADELRSLELGGNARFRAFLEGETIGVSAAVWCALPATPDHVLTRMAHVYVHVHMHVHVRVHVRTSASLSLSSSH